MSASFDIVASTGTYPVTVGAGLLADELARAPQAVVLCDERFAATLAAPGRRVIAVAAREEDKDLAAMPGLIRRLRQAGVTRDTELLAIGGGIVQDIATFCASTYMRGLVWRYAPTTLLGMVDSCIGGKSSINVGEYKNLVGTIHPPRAIAVDTTVVASLDVTQRIAGLCEAAKICFARGPEAFAAYLATTPGPSMDDAALERMIVGSLKAKKWFIEIDEFDRAERLLLNFGHTFGHALESASAYALPHGIAVGLGMLCAQELSERLGRRTASAPMVPEFLAHLRALLANVPETTAVLRGLSVEAAFKAFCSDKKHGAAHFTVILIDGRGALERLRLPRDEAHSQLIQESFAALVSGTTA